ncbi:MAG: hypothetical protein FWD68_20170 [Alphaproteobacteria bacterium]|nr:hypothetical protein [Alphaproteobacteria bacterium]
MDAAVKVKRPKISVEEMKRRRKIIDDGIQSNAIEGARHDCRIDPVLEAFIAGEFDISELVSRAKQALA